MEKIYKNRISMFDFAKGVAMILIVSTKSLMLYDVFDESVIGLCWRIISFPGTAALLLAMGYWYTPMPVAKRFRLLLQSEIKAYGITIIATVVAFVALFWSKFYSFTDALRELPRTVEGLVLGFSYSIGALWYILTYIIGILILNILLNRKVFQEHKILLYLLFTIMAAAGFVLGQGSPPFCIAEVLGGVTTFYVGHRMRQTDFLIRKWRWKDWLLLIALTVLNCAVYYGYEFITYPYGAFNHVGMLMFIPGGILLLRFSLFIQNLDARSTDWVLEIGNNCVLIMMILTVEDLTFNWAIVANMAFMPYNVVWNGIAVLIMRAIIYILFVSLFRHKESIRKSIIRGANASISKMKEKTNDFISKKSHKDDVSNPTENKD